MKRSVFGLLGPSYVGKSTLLRHLLDRGPFVQAPIWTTRPPRRNEPDDLIQFLTEERASFTPPPGDWLVTRVGPYLYGVDIGACRALAQRAPVIVGVTPSTLQGFKQRIPELFAVLLWPADPVELQEALAADEARPLEERRQRLAMNERDFASPPEVDLVLEVRRISSPAARMSQLESFRTTLLELAGEIPCPG